MVAVCAIPFSLTSGFMDTLRDILGDRVRTFREARDWSQEELGKLVGVGGKYIGNIERGQKTASFDVIERLAKALGVESYRLFVPRQRRADAIERHLKQLLSQPGKIDLSQMEDFLKALLVALRKLDR